MANKKQHVVPVSYLKAWCDPETPIGREPYVWVFERNERTGKPKAPHNIFWELDFYTLPGEEGHRDLTLEKGLGRLESDFATVRRKKLDARQQITQREHFIVCAFCAAMHVRTRAQRDYFAAQWRDILDAMDRMAGWVQKAPQAALSSFGRSILTSEQGEDLSLSHEDVRQIVQYPAQSLLPHGIRVEMPILARMNMAILCTDDRVGFITSDHPCLWFDPASPNMPPGLDSKTTEVILPLSPQQLLLLNWRGLSGYIDMPLSTVAQANRSQRCSCDKQYVARRNHDFLLLSSDEQLIWNQETPNPPAPADRKAPLSGR